MKLPRPEPWWRMIGLIVVIGTLSLTAALSVMSIVQIRIGQIVCKEKNISCDPSSEDYSREVGHIWSLYNTISNVVTFICIGLYGSISDIIGRKPMLLICFFVWGIDTVLSGLLSSVEALIIAHAASGICSGAYVFLALSFASAADVVPENKRTGAFGTIEGGLWIGVALGPLWSSCAGTFVTLEVACYVASSLLFLCFLLVLVFYKEPRGKHEKTPFSWQRMNPFSSLWFLIRHRTARIPGIVFCFMLTAMTMRMTGTLLYEQHEFSWGLQQAGIYSSIQTIGTAIVGSFLIHWIALWLGEIKTTSVGSICYGISLALWGLASKNILGSSLYLWLAIIPMAGGGIAVPSSRSLISKSASAEDQGQILGGLGSLEALSTIISPILFDQVYSRTISSFSGAWCFVAAGLYLIAALLVLVSPSPRPLPVVDKGVVDEEALIASPDMSEIDVDRDYDDVDDDADEKRRKAERKQKSEFDDGEGETQRLLLHPSDMISDVDWRRNQHLSINNNPQ